MPLKSLKPKLLLLAACLALGACNNAIPPAPAATPAASAAPAEPARAATHDSTLQPHNVVWDSPEKQHAWEQRNAAGAEGAEPVVAPELQPVTPVENEGVAPEQPAASPSAQ